MSFIQAFVVVMSGSWSFACRYDKITIGIVANGTGVIESENFSSHGQDFIVIKDLVDTSEVYKIFRSVQRFDADKSVDVIVLVDYDTTLLMIPDVLKIKNKKVIKLGARDENDKMSTHACGTNGQRCVQGSEPRETYCLTDLNITHKNRDALDVGSQVPLALRTMIKSLQWKRIVLFYEESNEWGMTRLVDGLSKDGVLCAMYNIDQVVDIMSILESIYKLKREAEKEIHIVVISGVANTKRVLKAANKFDSLNKEKTVLKMFSRWLIALYDYNQETARELQECAKDLDNVAVVALPEQKTITIKNVYDSIVSAALEILKGKFEGSLEEVCKEDFINKFETKTHTLNPTSLCQGFYIDTLLWKREGRQFSHVGYADVDGKVVLNSDVFPNTRFGYNNRSFLVSTLPYSPFVVKRKFNNTYTYDGFCMDLLKELSRKLNFTYTIIEPADKKWGSVTNRVNLTFNGLVGQLQREEVDIVASAISVQAERDPAMDFSYPYYYGYTTVLVKKPDVYASKWRTLVDPFKWEVLLTIGASLLVVTVLVFLLEKNNPFYTIPMYAQQREENGGLHTWHSSFWYVFGALLCQGGVHLPESTAGRTLISCWWLTCIIIVGTYCGNLIAFLTVTKERPPFNTLKEMNDLKGTYKWGTIGGTVWESMFPNSSNPTFRKMGEAFIEFNKTDPTILHGNPAFHVERVKKGKYAWIGDKTYMEIAMATQCSLMTIKEEFMPLIYVLGFKNNSSHASIFSEQIIKIHEGGLLQIWKRKWWPKASFCAGNSITEAKPISLMDVQSAFYVCFIGIFFGCSAFLVEKLVHKYRTIFKN